MTTAAGELLAIRDLRVEFGGGREPRVTALDGIDLEIRPREVLGIVGETGCGKTMTGLAALGLLPPGARVTAGSVAFEGIEISGLSHRALRRLRGRRMAMIFQNPASAFNPVFTIGWQIDRVMREHLDLGRAGRRERLAEVLREVGLPEVERVTGSYPHQLSGGMLQRAMIAMALVNRPSLVIADEPTTALDATIASQILGLLRRLQAEHGFGVLFVTHDLGVVRQVCQRVAVLYAGRVVETAPTAELFAEAQHPYTRGLLRAIPTPQSRGGRLAAIEGSVPADPGAVVGCAFRPRCPVAIADCASVRPPAVPISATHASACHLAHPRPAEAIA